MNYSKLIRRDNIQTVLGIDASTNSVAFCLMNATGPVKWGEIEFKGSTVFERLSDGQRKVSTMRKELEADLIVIESAVYVQNKKTVILLAYAFGAILSALMRAGSKVEELSPTEWQSAIGNKVLNKVEKQTIMDATPDKSKTWYSAKFREFRKNRTMKWVKDTYGIDVKSDNVSDAIAIAHVGYERFAK